ncbi:MAG: serine kinase [Pseudomonadota bacterium]
MSGAPIEGQAGPAPTACPCDDEIEEIPAGTVLHASAVATGRAHGERGVLILGPSGSGKTRLALELIAMGGALDIALIGDDRVQVDAPLVPAEGAVMRPVPTIAGLVDIRGVGILRHPYRQAAPLWSAVDLGVASRQGSTRRIMAMRYMMLAGVQVPCLPGGVGLHAAALLAMLRTGRLPDPEHAPAVLNVAVPGADPND